MKRSYLFNFISSLLGFIFYLNSYAAPCSFDASQDCVLFRDILNDLTSAGLHYYAPTNYDHRFSGEINVFDATLVTPYTDAVNAKGQIKLTANRINSGFFRSGEIMTRIDLDKPPFNASVKSAPFTTQDINHGYIEVTVKFPKCDRSDDSLCQNNNAPEAYTRGLWPAVWLLPIRDDLWPQNGEIDLVEAYQKGKATNVGTAALHFNGNDPRCGNNDCKFVGFLLTSAISGGPLFQDFHKWGFEWKPDPGSTIGGMIITGYFDNVKQWGPIKTDTLPADGPAGLSRGFHDPIGGFHLITALAVGGPYAGAPNAHLQSANMYIQSIKAYSVGTVTGICKPPINIQSIYSRDKKQVTFSWQRPTNSATIVSYQINDSHNILKWKSASNQASCFTDKTLPGSSGTFTYYFYSNCVTGQSNAFKYNVVIP